MRYEHIKETALWQDWLVPYGSDEKPDAQAGLVGRVYFIFYGILSPTTCRLFAFTNPIVIKIDATEEEKKIARQSTLDEGWKLISNSLKDGEVFEGLTGLGKFEDQSMEPVKIIAVAPISFIPEGYKDALSFYYN